MDETDKREPHIDDQEIDRIQRARNIWYLKPTELVSVIWEFLSDWWETRNWKAISVIVPPLVLLFGLAGLVLIGKFRSRESLRALYQAEATTLVNELVKTIEQGQQPEAKDIAKSELLFKRILQLGDENLDSRFFVAEMNLLLGQTDVARRMIERISPSDRPGLPAGHGWVAKDLLARASKGEAIPIDVLKHHLQNNLERTSEGIDPQLCLVYASILDRENRTSDAARILTKAGEVEPKLQLNVIEYFVQRNLPNQAKGSADSLIEKLLLTLKQKDPNDKDKPRNVILVARAYALTGRVDESITLLNSNAPTPENLADWKRCMSENYRKKFRNSFIKDEGRVQVNLNFLNAAIAADPTNLAVQSDLELLHGLGISSSDERRQALVNLIAKEGNSIVPKLMLADGALRNEDLRGAIAYYELILAELPDFTLVLNNLAALLPKQDPANFERANQLIDKAIQLSPEVSDFHDTKGDIESQSGRAPEAIKHYLSALELAPARQRTRTKLIEHYVSVGNDEAVAQQRQLYERVEEELKKAQDSLQQAEKGAQAPVGGETPTP